MATIVKEKEPPEELDDYTDNPVEDPDRPPKNPPRDPRGPAVTDRVLAIREARFRWVESLRYWQIANEEAVAKRYPSAAWAYDECQKAVLRYFEKFYTTDTLTFPFVAGSTTAEKLNVLVSVLFKERFWIGNTFFWIARKVFRRREAITLNELYSLDWGSFTANAQAVLKSDTENPTEGQLDIRQNSLDYFALVLATVLVPLARAEMNRIGRNLDAAIDEYERLLQPYPRPLNGTAPVWLINEFIEKPFILLALGELRMARAEDQFRAAAQGKADAAKQTYQSILDLFAKHGTYADRVNTAREKLIAGAVETTPNRELELLAKNVTVPGIKANTKELPGLSRTKAPAESWLKFESENEGSTNSRIYSLLLNAHARLLQIEKGFNYLGYKDDYVPPWRFNFLLERARYFAEHAKNAQREYLNFLGNAEREEFQEGSAAQSVEMEKSNVRIDTARVDQVVREVEAVTASVNQAQKLAEDANKRLKRYKEFDRRADTLMGTGETAGALQKSFNYSPTGLLGRALGGFFGEFVHDAQTGVIDYFSGGAASRAIDRAITSEQREYEKFSMDLAAKEAQIAVTIARKQLGVTQAGLVVAGLQRQATLLRHEFALQNLQYLRNRTLNAEQWFRLADAIRAIADTYLRYAIELAFLCEQAYEFEADKRINVIRFDYDQSELGAYLAADFLQRDLDTIEQDFVVNQRQRQQQVRYVLSLAREFPAAMEELRETGTVNFMLRLEQIERRFPGLYNMRVGMVDVLPVALMDSTRFSLDLTHAGAGQLRIKGQPDVPVGETSESVLNVSNLPAGNYDWTKTPQELWPVKILVHEPETAVFSGLSRQDAAAAFPVASAGQRNAFEGRALAGGWKIDMSARENQLAPDTLADLLITFTVSGYHNSDLRAAIEETAPETRVSTGYLSGRQIFPDALHELNRSGRMDWKVTRDLLTVSDTVGRLRNIAMLLVPARVNSNYFGRLFSNRVVRFRVPPENGKIKILSALPRIVFTFDDPADPLKLTARASLTEPTTFEVKMSWDFGDGSPRAAGAEQHHNFKKPGRYSVNLRVEINRRFTEFQSEVVVSRTHGVNLVPPVWASVVLTPETTGDIPAGHTRVKCTLDPTSEVGLVNTWAIGQQIEKGDTVTFDLLPGDYTLSLSAVRRLKAQVSCSERFFFDRLLKFDGLNLTTNRRFDVEGNILSGGDNPPANELTFHLYAETSVSPDFPTELSPVNEWTVEFPLPDNACLRSVSATDVEHYDLSEIQDAVLALEYETEG